MDFQLDKINFLSKVNKNDIRNDYEFVKQIGSGAFGIIYEGLDKKNKNRRAIKAIYSNDLKDREIFENEIKILKQLDHPNIVKLYDVYDFKNTIYLVMELCEGGDLLSYITKFNYITEKTASQIMRQILSATQYIHSKNICHRDIKPENFLLQFADNSNFTIKMIDFGLSKNITNGDYLSDTTGTIYFMAPEVFDENYDLGCDNWSLGVVLYVILSGVPPFMGKDNMEIKSSIKRGVYTLSLKPFQKCSIEVKDLISKLLAKNPSKRYTSHQAYNHPWVQNQVEIESENMIISEEIIKKIKDFKETKILKKAFLLYIAQIIPEKDIELLKQTFLKMDKDGSGTLSLEEFKESFQEYQSLSKSSTKLDEDLIINLFKSLDGNNNGIVEYSEFLMLFSENYLYKTERYIKEAFEKFDLDKNGKINSDELRNVLSGGSLIPFDKIDSIIEQADTNKDGEVIK